MQFSLTIPFGRQTITVTADTLEDVLREASELETIARRAPEAELRLRRNGKFEYVEAVKRLENGRTVRKALSRRSEDGRLFLAADEPWTVYKDGQTWAQWDVITDNVRAWGFTEAKRWYRVTTRVEGGRRIYLPVR